MNPSSDRIRDSDIALILCGAENSYVVYYNSLNFFSPAKNVLKS